MAHLSCWSRLSSWIVGSEMETTFVPIFQPPVLFRGFPSPFSPTKCANPEIPRYMGMFWSRLADKSQNRRRQGTKTRYLRCTRLGPLSGLHHQLCAGKRVHLFLIVRQTPLRRVTFTWAITLELCEVLRIVNFNTRITHSPRRIQYVRLRALRSIDHTGPTRQRTREKSSSRGTESTAGRPRRSYRELDTRRFRGKARLKARLLQDS